MPSRSDWLSRIKSVEGEYRAMRQAADWFDLQTQKNPTILLANLRPADIERASKNLEGTYLMRLFAEFETGARQYWSTKRQSIPGTADLLKGLAALRNIPDTHLDDCDRVREYRNSLVHEREDEVEAVPIAEARGHLCRFFSFLPLEW
jgi:hypothetical protein